MLDFVKEKHRDRLLTLCDEEEAEVVLKWLEVCELRKPVGVIGAGFSKNAEPRLPELRPNIPLWKDFRKLFAQALVPKPNAEGKNNTSEYTIPHLAELYEEQFGYQALVDALLDLFPDADLKPGPLHNALFTYEFESIITTNHLDTLLDHSPTWVKLIYDTDLLKTRHNYGEKELIYIHGHRDHPSSWVVTRSQYEDVSHSKPGIATRMRQLFLQHPLLILGYSLSDPDFHWVYRTIGNVLGKHVAFTIAIFPEKPEPAEKKHWRRLGIHLISFKSSGSDFPSQLMNFMQMSGAGLWSSLSLDAFLDTLKNARSFGDRLHVLREAFDHRLHFPNPLRVSPELASHWLSVATYTVGLETWTQIQQWVGATELPESVVNWPVNENFDQVSWSFSSSIPKKRFSFLVNYLLEEKGVDVSEVAEWLGLGINILNDSPFGSPSDTETDVISIAVEVFKKLLRQNPRSYKAAALQSLTEARKLATTLNLDESAEQCRVFCIELDPTHDRIEPSIGPFHKEPLSAQETEYLAEMKRGFDSARACDDQVSLPAYLSAARIARAAKNLLNEWLALRSVLSQPKRLNGNLPESLQESITQAITRKTEIGDAPPVKRFLEFEQYFLQKARDALAEERMAEARREKHGTIGYSYHNAYYHLWRFFRVLELKYVAPQVQKGFVEVLIKSQANDDLSVFEESLSYGFEYSKDIIERLAEKNDFADVNARRNRDEKIVSILLNRESLITQRTAQLKQLDFIASFLLTSQIPDFFDFLSSFKSTFGSLVNTMSGTSIVSDDFGSIWLKAISMLPTVDAGRALHKYYSTSLDPREDYAFSREVNRLDLWQKISRMPKPLQRDLIALVIDHCVEKPVGPFAQMSTGRWLEVFLHILESLPINGIPNREKTRLLVAIKDLIENTHEDGDVPWLALLIIEQLVQKKALYEDYFNPLFRQIYSDAQAATAGTDRFLIVKKLNTLLSFMAGIQEYAKSRRFSREENEEIIDFTYRNRRFLIGYIEKNPHRVHPIARFFALAHSEVGKGHQKKCLFFLRALLDKAPQTIEYVLTEPSQLQMKDVIIDPTNFWGDVLNGNLTQTRTEGLIIAFGFVRRTACTQKTHDFPGWFGLKELVFFNLRNPNLHVAYLAARALSEIAKFAKNAAEAKRISKLLLQLAEDQRPEMRSCAAFTSKWLVDKGRVDKRRYSSLNKAAEKICRKLREDPYAIVQAGLGHPNA